MRFAKPVRAVAALVFALTAVLPMVGCGNTVQNPTQEQEQEALATKLDGAIDVGFDTTGLTLVLVTQQSQERDGSGDSEKLVTKGAYEAANDLLQVDGSYEADWSLADKSWELDGCTFTPEKVTVLAAPSNDEAQTIVRDGFATVAEGLGISQDLIDAGDYRAESLTVTGVTFDKDSQTATVEIDVKGLLPLALNGTAQVELIVTDSGWEIGKVSSDDVFKESYVGTWVGTLIGFNESYMQFPVVDESSGWIDNTDQPDASCTVTVTSESEPDANGVVRISGNVTTTFKMHVVDMPSYEFETYVTNYEDVTKSFDFEDEPVEQVDHGLAARFGEEMNRASWMCYLMWGSYGIPGSPDDPRPDIYIGETFLSHYIDWNIGFYLARE